MKNISNFNFHYKFLFCSRRQMARFVSYNHIIKIKQDDKELIVVTKSGLFYYNVASGEIRKLSKANGLHEVGITAFDYNPDTKIGLIGYCKTGALDIVTPNGVTLIVDIPIARSYQGSKKINHIL